MELDELLMLENPEFLSDTIANVSWLIQDTGDKKVKKYLKHYLAILKVLEQMKNDENRTNN